MAEHRLSMPYADTAFVKFFSQRLEEVTRDEHVSQRELAHRMGYDKPNIVSMYKTGSARVPLDKVPVIAKVIGVDVNHLLRLAIEQYWPDKNNQLNKMWGNLASDNEMALLYRIRESSNNTDPIIPEAAVANFLAEAFGNDQPRKTSRKQVSG